MLSSQIVLRQVYRLTESSRLGCPFCPHSHLLGICCVTSQGSSFTCTINAPKQLKYPCLSLSQAHFVLRVLLRFSSDKITDCYPCLGVQLFLNYFLIFLRFCAFSAFSKNAAETCTVFRTPRCERSLRPVLEGSHLRQLPPPLSHMPRGHDL